MSKPKRNKNLKIDTKTHSVLKSYCDKNGLKMFAFVEKLIRESCTSTRHNKKDDLYDD
jgi:hypothetical protein|tara:strand:+ start:628 stop:801 length:174 start_codon:yes stop_codon:yes gene_type:complete